LQKNFVLALNILFSSYHFMITF